MREKKPRKLKWHKSSWPLACALVTVPLTFEVTLEVMYSPMSRLPYSGIIEMVKFISWEKRSEKPFSVSFFPTKIISKGDLWVKLGVGYFNSCWNLLLPFWHVQWEFFPTVYSPALSCEKNAFRSFSSHIREGHYESQWAWGLGGTEGTLDKL